MTIIFQCSYATFKSESSLKQHSMKDSSKQASSGMKIKNVLPGFTSFLLVLSQPLTHQLQKDARVCGNCLNQNAQCELTAILFKVHTVFRWLFIAERSHQCSKPLFFSISRHWLTTTKVSEDAFSHAFNRCFKNGTSLPLVSTVRKKHRKANLRSLQLPEGKLPEELQTDHLSRIKPSIKEAVIKKLFSVH